MKKESTASRLKEIMSQKKLRQVDILTLTAPYCKKYGIKMNKSDISQYCAGKTEPNQEKLFVLGKALDVSESWLMGFDVPSNRNDRNVIDYDSTSHPKSNKIEFCQNTPEYRLMKNIKILNNKGKKNLLEYSEILLGNPNFTDTNSSLTLNAAHARTDILVTDEMKQHDDNIMMDDSEWE